MYVTLEEAKAQVSVHPSNAAHDDRLERLILAAETWARNFLNVDSLDEFEESPVTSPPTLPEDMKSGILLHIEAEFDRDVSNFELLLQRARDLLWPYRTTPGAG